MLVKSPPYLGLSLLLSMQNLWNTAGILYGEANILTSFNIRVFNNICAYFPFSFKYS